MGVHCAGALSSRFHPTLTGSWLSSTVPRLATPSRARHGSWAMPRVFVFLPGILLLAGAGCARKPQAGVPLTAPKPVVTMAAAAAVVTPRVEPGNEVTLPDDFPVVGVVVDGQAR